MNPNDPRFVSGGEAARGAVTGVEPVLEIDLRLPDHVVGAHEVPVEDLHRQHRVLGEGGLDLEAPAGGGREEMGQ